MFSPMSSVATDGPWPLVGGGFLTLCICLAARKLGQHLSVIDLPDLAGRKHHERATPLMGGIAVMIPVIAMAVILGVNTPFFLILAALASGFLVMGHIDDRQGLAPSARLILAVSMAAAAVLCVPELALQKLNFPPSSVFLNIGAGGFLFTVLCLVGLQNAVNMADGKNGLVVGLSIIWSLLLLYYAPPSVDPLLAMLVVCLLVVLLFNLRGDLFLGDAGSYTLSVVLGCLAVYVYNSGQSGLSAAQVALWFLVPVLDCVRLMARRILAGRSPFEGDRNHLHHILWSHIPWPLCLILYWALVAVPAVISMIYPNLTLLVLGASLAIYLALVTVATRRPQEHNLSV